MAAPKAPAARRGRQEVEGRHPRGRGVFGAEVKPHLVHETVRAELAAARAGTKSVKSRGLVAGGRAKPWRQKGTGRARAGTTRAPQWTGGGVAFPPTHARLRRQGEPQGPQGALRGALSAHASERARSPCSTASAFDEPSTKKAARAFLEAWGKELPLLVVAPTTRRR